LAWQIEWEVRASRELLKLDKQVQRDIVRYLDDRIATEHRCSRLRKTIEGKLAGLWRYRIEDHRIICKILDKEITVMVIRVAHRRQAYDDD
jgi:mRNA interferase RelE/StbE